MMRIEWINVKNGNKLYFLYDNFYATKVLLIYVIYT